MLFVFQTKTWYQTHVSVNERLISKYGQIGRAELLQYYQN